MRTVYILYSEFLQECLFCFCITLNVSAIINKIGYYVGRLYTGGMVV